MMNGGFVCVDVEVERTVGTSCSGTGEAEDCKEVDCWFKEGEASNDEG